MVENTLDEETEAGWVDVRRLRARRGDLRVHELVTAPKDCGKWLVDYNKLRRVKQPYQKQINNQSRYCKLFTRRYLRHNKGIVLCSEFYATRVIDANA